MTFLNAILALGASAFLVPLVIHLLYRSRYQVVEWGAMRFLQSSRSSNSRRFQWKQLLLLLLRCAIPVFLALAMSRPLVQSWLAAGLGKSVALAILIDDSVSMQALRDDNTTRWKYALKQVEQILDELPTDARLGVALAGSPPRFIEWDSRSEFSEWIRSSEQNPSMAGSLEIDGAQSLALDWLGREPSAAQYILLVTDLEEKDWEDRAEVWEQFAKRLSQQVVAPKFSVLNTAGNANEQGEERLLGNLNVHLRDSSPRWATPEQTIEFKVTVFNDSTEPRQEIPVRLFIDNAEVEEQRISVSANSQSDISFRWTPSEAREHIARVSLEADDRLRYDNDSMLAVRVLSPVRVLLVDGDRKPEKMESESDYLKRALAPFSQLATGRTDPFECTVLGPSEWGESQLQRTEVLVLCNVSSLTENQSVSLADWVRRGGGLLIFPGDKVNSDSWNRLPTIEQGGIRNVEWKPRTSTTTELSTQPSNSALPQAQSAGILSIDTDTFQWDKLQELSRPSLESLRDTLIDSYHPISKTLPEGTGVVAKLSNGDPWIVRSGIGKGSILSFSFSCDRGDSNLPSRAAFVPLVQRIVLFAAGRDSKPAKLVPGEAWALAVSTPADEVETATAVESGMDKVTVANPFGEMKEWTNSEWLDTRQQGLYEATKVRDSEQTKTYAVVDSRARESDSLRESRLMSWSSQSADSLFQEQSWTLSDSAADYLEAIQSDFRGREIWSWFWIAAIVCFLAEMALEQSYLPNRKTRLSQSKASLEGSLR